MSQSVALSRPSLSELDMATNDRMGGRFLEFIPAISPY